MISGGPGQLRRRDRSNARDGEEKSAWMTWVLALLMLGRERGQLAHAETRNGGLHFFRPSSNVIRYSGTPSPLHPFTPSPLHPLSPTGTSEHPGQAQGRTAHAASHGARSTWAQWLDGGLGVGSGGRCMFVSPGVGGPCEEKEKHPPRLSCAL